MNTARETVAKQVSQATPGQVVEELPLDRYRIDYTVPDDTFLFKTCLWALQSCLGAGWVAKLSKRANEDRLPGENIFSSYVRHIGVNIDVRGFDVSRISKTDSLVFVANHPTGMVDGHLLGSVIESNIRSDFKLLTVPRFCELPGLREYLIPVHLPSPSGRTYRDADRLIAESRERARRHVQNGGSMVIFPCGPGASRTSEGIMQDGEWRHGAFALAQQAGAKVVPVHIDAPIAPIRNLLLRMYPLLFHAAAPHDAMYLNGKTVTVTFGDPESTELQEALSDLSTAPAKVRELVYRLRG